jgi:predicted Zn finger-like uncharacterized protein
MIATCPRCSVRYRIAKEKLKPEGVRMRCARCEAIFRVRAPAPAASTAATPSPSPTAPAAAPPTQRPSAPVPDRPRPAAEQKRETVDRERLALVAFPDAELAKQTASTLSGCGLHTSVVHDGVEAMLEIQRQLPRVVILSASLPKMFGFQICELMKRNESLRSIPVVLAGSIYHTHRYRREPNQLYGADAYIEDPDLPGGLIPVLERIGIPVTPAATPPAEPAPQAPPQPPLARAEPPEPALPPESAPAPLTAGVPAAEPAAPPESAPAPAPTSVPAALTGPEPAVARDDDGLGEERAKAERLARIIVSDIVLYNEEKFADAVRRGCVEEVMGPDLEEGRDLFRDRIDERVREERDYLVTELLRVARMRAKN